ncbi:MAG: hypothetical protein PHG18_02090, partial [Bacilli bacterium]|nr:hypothetical protein [Bacilli bacterium]
LYNIILRGGMDVTQLENTMDKYLNHKKFYKSNIDYGLVTVNLSSFKPVVLQKKDISPHQLKDYLMASATCFPAFKMKNIDDDLFIDGAYYEKLPINQAIDMGATSIIAVDLNSFGITHKIKEKDIPITYIVPRNKLDSFLLFDSNFTRRSIKLGYNDAMKTFKRLDGQKYTFRLNHVEKNFNQYHQTLKSNLLNMADLNGKNKRLTEEILKKNKISAIINDRIKTSQKIMLDIMEYLGEMFKLNDSLIYHISIYNKSLIEAINNYENFNIDLIEKKIKNKETIKLADKSYFIKYLYSKMEIMHNNPKIKKELCTLARFFERDVLAALYIYTICNK